jgi:DNA polymerase III epsilon subunit-like protein
LVNLSKEVFSILDKSNSFMILDIETSYHGEIIEIGYLVYDKEEEKILKSKNYLVRPKVITNNFFNNIKIEEIEKGLRIKEVIELISDDIKNNTLVGHNIKSFDYPKISKE